MSVAMAKGNQLLNIMAKRCRICLTDSTFMIKLCDKLVESKFEDLTRCTCIDMQTEYKKNLPDGICHICFYKLSMWAEFKDLFVQSHKILLEQLEISEASNNNISVNNSKNNRHLKRDMKQTSFNQSNEDSISPIDKKKSKIDKSLPKVRNVNTEEVIIDTICISDSEGESVLSKDFSPKACNINKRELNENVKNDNEEHTKNESGLSKSREFYLSRARAKRKTRLKRLERKKKLPVSESVYSNDAQLTPMQKAQTKTKDKEAIKQKRIANLLRKLKTNLSEKYIGLDTCTSRLRNQAMVSPSEKNTIEKNTIETRFRYSMEEESSSSSVEDNVTANGAIISQENNTSKSSKTELVIGKTTFIVTSSIILQDHQSGTTINQTLNNSKKNSESANGNINGNSKENTDIFDAVQLRKVTPVILEEEDITNPLKKLPHDVERCLDIRIESQEFTMLKHMQTELSDFIQKEVKPKYLSISEEETESVNNTNDSQTKLDQKLKNLIQDTIEKNIEDFTDGNDARYQGFQRVSPAFVKAAMNSPRYQPRVVVKRLNLANYSKSNTLKRAAPRRKSNAATPQKRLVVLPKKYDDFNTMFESNFSDLENTAQETLKRAGRRTCKNSTVKRFRNKITDAINKKIKQNNSIVTINKDNDAKSVPFPVKQDLMNREKINENRVEIIIPKTGIETFMCKLCTFRCNTKKSIMAHVRTSHITLSEAKDNAKEDLKNREKMNKNSIEINNSTDVETYMCQICKFKCNSVKDIEEHVRIFHITPLETKDKAKEDLKNGEKPINKNTQQNIILPQKEKYIQKKMRCKKCHEIVDYRCVKSHAVSCKMNIPHLIYVCPNCEATFLVKKSFLQHLETHKSKSTSTVKKIVNKRETVGLQLPTVSEALQKGYAIQTKERKDIRVMPLKQTNETNVQSTIIGNSNIQSNKVTATDEKSDIAKNVQKNKQYSCFLCDKVFTDDELLKDHLQQHCDDWSDEDQSKDVHKCTICDKNLESNQALEEHICKHWFDGEDTNNFNNTSLKDGNSEDATSTDNEFHQCSQCWELFDSKVLLQLHTRVHVPKISTTEQNEEVIYQYQCTLCDDLLNTENDLAEHVRLHNENAQICQLCDKPFRTLEELQEHISIHL